MPIHKLVTTVITAGNREVFVEPVRRGRGSYVHIGVRQCTGADGNSPGDGLEVELDEADTAELIRALRKLLPAKAP